MGSDQNDKWGQIKIKKNINIRIKAIAVMDYPAVKISSFICVNFKARDLAAGS
jgi:hypothetical protein